MPKFMLIVGGADLDKRSSSNAELHASLDELDRARDYLDRALTHQPSRVQRALLERKRAALAR